jgi:hypothetical protein
MSTDLVMALINGQSIDLIHRSEIIGKISPQKAYSPKLFDSGKFLKIVESLNIPKLTPLQRDKNYREAMERKHGKRIY